MRELKIYFVATEKFCELNYELKLAVRKAIEEALDYEGFDKAAEVSVTFCSPGYIQGLNREYREKDAPTDVLSFPMFEKDELSSDDMPEPVALGDIVISVPRAKEQAEELGNSFEREVSFLAIHSTLHLLGYDHEMSPADDEDQCRRQKEIIEKLYS